MSGLVHVNLASAASHDGEIPAVSPHVADIGANKLDWKVRQRYQQTATKVPAQKSRSWLNFGGREPQNKQT